MLRAAGWALLSWLCYGVHAYLLARSLGVEGGAPLWLQCTGVREAALLLLLGSTVTVPVAAVIAVSSRLLFIVGDLAWSAVAVLAARRVLRPPGPPPPP